MVQTGHIPDRLKHTPLPLQYAARDGNYVQIQRTENREQGTEIRDQRTGIRKTRGVGFVVSHPFARKKAKGWGTDVDELVEGLRPALFTLCDTLDCLSFAIHPQSAGGRGWAPGKLAGGSKSVIFALKPLILARKTMKYNHSRRLEREPSEAVVRVYFQ